MSCVTVYSACVLGPHVIPVSVEVDIQPGLPTFRIIGLPDAQIREARERIRSAIKNSGYKMPASRITVNLTPAHLPKQGTMFDLAIALGILRKQMLPGKEVWVIGQLALDGGLVVPNYLTPILIEAGKQKINCIIPTFAHSACHCPTKQCTQLREVVTLPDKPIFIQPKSAISEEAAGQIYLVDQIVGQSQAKRVLEIALAGKHNLILSGPPGSGKTMLATAAQQLLPSLNEEERIDVAQIYALRGISYDLNQGNPPLRTISTRISPSSLFGSTDGKIGEISLAHQGILFLDEFPEFPRSIREGLRQPLQDRMIHISHKGVDHVYPANCLVIAAQNECSCGLKGVIGQTCRCSAGDLQRYQRAFSQPLIDRFDLYCQVPQVDIAAYSPIQTDRRGQDIQEAIVGARRLQRLRFGTESTNSQMCPAEIKRCIPLNADSKEYLRRAATSLYLSVRGFDSILKVARTIADLEGKINVELRHIQEATQYRYRVKPI